MVEGVRHADGETISVEALSPGSLASLLWTRAVVEVPEILAQIPPAKPATKVLGK